MNSKIRRQKSIAIFSSLMMVLLALSAVFTLAPYLLQQQNSFGQQTTTNATTPSTTNQSSVTNITTNMTSTTDGLGSILKLSQSNIPIDIPMMKGYENGHELFFIATDASNNQTAVAITNQTGFKVNVAPVLAMTPESALNQAYGFTNGIPGDGPFGFQLPGTSCQTW